MGFDSALKRELGDEKADRVKSLLWEYDLVVASRQQINDIASKSAERTVSTNGLLIACYVLYHEKWMWDIHNLLQGIAVSKSGLRLAGTNEKSLAYWQKRLDEDEHELALLENLVDAMVEARKA